MKTARPVFIEDDAWAHVDRVAASVAAKRGRQVSHSEILEWLIRKHQAATMKAKMTKPPKLVA